MTKPSPAERIVHILTEMYYEKQRITQTATSLAVAATISSYFRISDRNSDTLFGYRISGRIIWIGDSNIKFG